MAISAEDLEEFVKEVNLEDQPMYYWYDPELENQIIDILAEEIKKEIDREIMAELIAEVERDRKEVKRILPDKLFEV